MGLPPVIQNLIQQQPPMPQLEPGVQLPPDPTQQGAPAPQSPAQSGITLDDLRNLFNQGAQPAPAPKPTKGHKLLQILQGGLTGALSGEAANAQLYAQTGRNGGFGVGAGAGFTQSLPYEAAAQQIGLQRGGLENRLLSTQLQLAPYRNLLDLLKGNSEVNKNNAEAQKNTAEAGAIPTKQDLERAQAQAANYKEVGGMLYDVSGSTPQVVAGQTAPLDADEAAILGKQPGEQVPMQIKNQANEMKSRGIRAVQAGGRSLLVDNKGNTIKDMGAATPLVIQQNQMQPGQITPDMQNAIDMVGQNKVDLQSAMGPFRRYPGQAMTFLGGLSDQYPNYFQGDFGASKKVLEYFTSGEGAKNINAFNTATDHLTQLSTLATALGNKDNQTYNRIKNNVETWLGSSAPTNFNAVRNAVVAEVGKTFKGTVTDSEIESIQSNISNAQSPQQMDGFVNQALALMKSKMGANLDQYTRGRQAQPAFPGSNQASHPLDRFWRN